MWGEYGPGDGDVGGRQHPRERAAVRDLAAERDPKSAAGRDLADTRDPEVTLVRITDIRATPVTVPLHAPLRHANGCHWGRFVRTIVEVETDDGRVGLGEMGGGGEGANAAFQGLKPYLVGRDPARLEEMRFLVANPTASLYNNRTQIVAALEFACLDLLGQRWEVPVSEILGGRLRERVPFASYLFFRYPRPDAPGAEVRTAEQLVAQARALKREHGFTSHKLKGGVFPPEYELACYRALAEALPGDRFRFDPNGVWSAEQAIRFGQQIEDIRNDYLEDPVYGLHGMRRVREKVRMPLATNTVVVNFEQLSANVLSTAVDVILLDTTFWGGIRPCVKAAGICETFQLGVAVHSSGELGIQLATMLHLGAVVPNLSFAADAHYHHLVDDVIVGGRMKYEGGAIAVPAGPGLGVRLDRDKLAEYHELFRRLGPYPYDQDPLRPGWAPLVPNDRWADPSDARVPQVPA
jgi:glucarate dehydratase